jgi:hypothetical protein
MNTDMAPGMADEVAREMKRLTKKDIVAGIKMHTMMLGSDRLGLHAEALGNLKAEYLRRYGKEYA